MCTRRVPRAADLQPAGPPGPGRAAGQFDLVHDNQCFGRGLLGMMARRLARARHPAPPDHRGPRLDLAHARGWHAGCRCAAGTGSSACRCEVARRMPRIVTVSESSKRDIVAQMGIAARPARRRPDRRGPPPASGRCPTSPGYPGRIMTTASADVPLKGLVPLLEALAKLRTERPRPPGGRRPAPAGQPGGRDDRPPRPGRRRHLRLRVSATTGWSSSTPRRRWPWCPRSTRASRCRPSRPWPAACPSWPRPEGPCPRWSAPTARPACSCLPVIRAPWPGRMGRVLDDPALSARLSEAGRRRALGAFHLAGVRGGHRRALPLGDGAPRPMLTGSRADRARPRGRPATGCWISGAAPAAMPSKPCATAAASSPSTPTRPRSRTPPP